MHADVSWIAIVAALFVGAAGAIVSAMAGGGGGLFFLPVMIFLGVPPHFAVAAAKCNDVGITVGVFDMVGAARRAAGRAFKWRPCRNLRRGRRAGPGSWLRANTMILVMVLITMINVWLSSWLIPLLVHLSWTNILIAYLMIGMAVMTVRSRALHPGERPSWRQKLGYPLYWMVSLAQGVFGMGIGMFISIVIMYAFGFKTAEANRLKRLFTTCQSLPLIVVLTLQGSMLLGLGVAALVGAICGARVGTLYVKGKGDRAIKKLLAIIMTISGILMLIMPG